VAAEGDAFGTDADAVAKSMAPSFMTSGLCSGEGILMFDVSCSVTM